MVLAPSLVEREVQPINPGAAPKPLVVDREVGTAADYALCVGVS
jgi:hypothetical protein